MKSLWGGPYSPHKKFNLDAQQLILCFQALPGIHIRRICLEFQFQLQIPDARCPMPNSQFPIPNSYFPFSELGVRCNCCISST